MPPSPPPSPSEAPERPPPPPAPTHQRLWQGIREKPIAYGVGEDCVVTHAGQTRMLLGARRQLGKD
jgi:hypothetical protein